MDSEGFSLIGEDNVYKPSEITLTNATEMIALDFYEFEGNTFISLNFEQMQSLLDYNFKLNDQETDILNLNINTREGQCFDIMEVVSFKLNNQEIQPVLIQYIIQK